MIFLIWFCCEFNAWSPFWGILQRGLWKPCCEHLIDLAFWRKRSLRELTEMVNVYCLCWTCYNYFFLSLFLFSVSWDVPLSYRRLWISKCSLLHLQHNHAILLIGQKYLQDITPHPPFQVFIYPKDTMNAAQTTLLHKKSRHIWYSPSRLKLACTINLLWNSDKHRAVQQITQVYHLGLRFTRHGISSNNGLTSHPLFPYTRWREMECRWPSVIACGSAAWPPDSLWHCKL